MSEALPGVLMLCEDAGRVGRHHQAGDIGCSPGAGARFIPTSERCVICGEPVREAVVDHGCLQRIVKSCGAGEVCDAIGVEIPDSYRVLGCQVCNIGWIEPREKAA